jgi:hypothetical protein
MNAPSIDIASMLEAESSAGFILGTNLFTGAEPSTPKNCTTIYDIGGAGPSLGFDNASKDYHYNSVYIRVRSTKYDTGYNLIHQIMELLHGRANETWNSTLYTMIKCISEPAMLDRDENQNFRFFCNFNLQRRSL